MTEVARHYTVQVCRAGWFVKRDSDGLVVSHGHATRESAEAFVREVVAHG